MLESLQPLFSTYTWIDRRILKRELASFSGKILDVGCGNKRLQEYLPSDTDYTGIDFNAAADIQMDISKEPYPFKDNSFDYIICNAVLEHVKNDDFVLNEIYRVLKPGGTLYVSIPFMQPYHADPDDFRRYTGYGLENKLKEHGFADMRSLEAYGTLLTIEYLVFAEVGKYLENKKRLLNPFRWLYLLLLLNVYITSKIASLILYPLQKNDSYISPGSKCICKKPA